MLDCTVYIVYSCTVVHRIQVYSSSLTFCEESVGVLDIEDLFSSSTKESFSYSLLSSGLTEFSSSYVSSS